MTSVPIPLVVRRTIKALPGPLFDAFATEASLTCWFTPSPDITVEALKYDFTPGGRFRLRYRMPDGRNPVVAGVFEVIDRPKQIVMTWEWQAPDPLENVPMKVSFRFLEKPNATEVVITHEGIPSDSACSIHADGWEATLSVLDAFFNRETQQ